MNIDYETINQFYEEKIEDLNNSFISSKPNFIQSYVLYFKNINSNDANTYKNNYESIKFFIVQKINEMEELGFQMKHLIHELINGFSEMNTNLDKEKHMFRHTKNKLQQIKNDYRKSITSLKDADELYKQSFIIYSQLIVGLLLVIYMEYKLFSGR
jgi:hypothetical protein